MIPHKHQLLGPHDNRDQTFCLHGLSCLVDQHLDIKQDMTQKSNGQNEKPARTTDTGDGKNCDEALVDYCLTSELLYSHAKSLDAPSTSLDRSVPNIAVVCLITCLSEAQVDVAQARVASSHTGGADDIRCLQDFPLRTRAQSAETLLVRGN